MNRPLHFYPTGVKMEGSWQIAATTIQKIPYLYNGNELIEELGLNVYVTANRIFDPALFRLWQHRCRYPKEIFRKAQF